MTKAKAKSTVTVVQTRSKIGCLKNQVLCLKALGLGKIGSKAVLEDNDCVKGLIRKVSHLVKIEGV